MAIWFLIRNLFHGLPHISRRGAGCISSPTAGRQAVAAFLCCLLLSGTALASRPSHIRDITEVQGVRGNQLIGYGLVVGLQGTGDRQQTFFTVQTLANTLQRLGVQIPVGNAVVKNIAAVMITAELPPFA